MTAIMGSEQFRPHERLALQSCRTQAMLMATVARPAQ